jgi:hypothetical protein
MAVIARRQVDPAEARAEGARRIAMGSAVLDCVFLASLIAISIVPYVRGLGFYYDDYSVLSRLEAAHDHSLAGLYHAVRPLNGQRPLQSFTFAALYRAFGLDPLGYHIVNAVLLVIVACLFYLVLRELCFPRLVCIALPLVYSTLPHYATNRFWLDAFQITLSSAFYLLSLYAGLRALSARRLALIGWLTLAVVGVAGCLFAYEVVFPLFAINLALLWWVARRARGPLPTAPWITIGAIAIAIVAVGVVKATLVAERGQNDYQFGFEGGFAHHMAYLVSGSLKLNVGTYFLAVPYVLWWIVRHRLTGASVGAAVAVGLLAVAYLWVIGRRERETLSWVRHWRAFIGVGIVVFLLGYAIFLTNQQVLFRSAGIDNRVNAAAALGVAAILLGLLSLLASRIPEQRRLPVFSIIAAGIVATGVFIIGALGSFWTSAATVQHSIISSLERTAPSLTRSTTVVLDGVCPEVGPAVVFGDESDFRGALRLAYDDPSLVADTATDTLRAGARDLVVANTFLGGRSTRAYMYGQRLVYDYPHRALHAVRNRADALRYVSSREALHCPPQRGFAWGFDPFRRVSLP